MKNLFTFSTASGKTQLRGYVKIALGLFVILVAIFGVNTYNRNKMVSEIMATPRSLDADLIPTPTEQVDASVSLEDECPSNPADWMLTPNASVPGSNLKKLSTECVYNELEKTAAWVYATTNLGYTRAEAAALLGLNNSQIVHVSDTLTVLTDYKDEPQKVSLIVEAPHPDFAEWSLDAGGEINGVSFTFVGCFRTFSISGEEVIKWGNGYPVVCQFFVDYMIEYFVGSLNGKIVTVAGDLSVRRTTWFGYSDDSNWVWLGSARGWDVDLSKIPSRDDATLDVNVMVEKYGIAALPLPQDWRAFEGKEYTEAFVAELNSGQ